MNFRKHLFFLLICFLQFSNLNIIIAQGSDLVLEQLLSRLPKSLQVIYKQAEKYKTQIIYTEINRNEKNSPSFTHHFFRLDSSLYFNPASTVKLPCSIFAVEKINSLKSNGICLASPFFTDSTNHCQVKVYSDTTSKNLMPSIEHYIKKMFLVSDNFSYSRVFEFLGVDAIHKRLNELGHPHARIKIRFDVLCNENDNLISNPFYFKDLNHGAIIYREQEKISQKNYPYPFRNALVGKSYLNQQGVKINQPFDFSKKNFLPLFDLHKIMQRLIFHPFLNDKERYNISMKDWEFLLKYLCAYPRESDYPKYDEKKFPDSYKKYFLYGSTKERIRNNSVRIYNIVGQSYGFLIDCAYVVDFDKKIEFMLSTVVYVNEKNIINSGNYEYKSKGLPFLSELGKLIYDYEKNRIKTYLPDLSQLPSW